MLAVAPPGADREYAEAARNAPDPQADPIGASKVPNSFWIVKHKYPRKMDFSGFFIRLRQFCNRLMDRLAGQAPARVAIASRI